MRKNVAGQKVTFSLFKAGARIANPTIAVADFKVDLDGAGQGNVATPPTSDAAGLVTWAPSQAETNGNVVTLLGLDAVGGEWEPLTISFDTAAETAIITNLDAAVSTRSTLAQADILSDATPFAGGNVDAAISTRGTANAGDAMALTVGERTTLAGVVWTYATRTLTSFGTLVADTAAAVWAYATRTLTSFTALTATLVAAIWAYTPRRLTTSASDAYNSNDGGKITLHRGDTANIDIADLGNLAARTKLWFTLKSSSDDADTAAIVMIEETAGLMYLNGADASLRAANGDITVTDAAAGDITVTLAAVETDDLTPGAYVYDVQMLTASGVATLAADDAIVTADITRRVA